MRKSLNVLLAVPLLMGLTVFPFSAEAGSNPCNPCNDQKKVNPCNPCGSNPCSTNPCATKKNRNPCNPCGARKNPCSMKPANPCNPCALKGNPCSTDANTAIRPHAYDNFWQAVAVGRKMWNDENLGTSGLACMSCHAGYEQLHLEKNQTFPHYVKMVGDVVTLDQMINYCMVNPMKGKQFGKNSRELTAMAAYYRAYRMQYLKRKRGL